MSTPFLYMKLIAGGKPIEGDSTEKHFEKQIVIDGLDWEMEASHEPVDDKRDPDKVKTTNRPKRVTLTKAFDRSTANLCNMMATRQQFSEAIIRMVKNQAWDQRSRTLIDVTLTKGYVESVSLTASESSLSVAVKESVTLSFETLKIVYHPDAPAGRGSDAPATTFPLTLPSEVG
jgi:type VI protein secretion system component Hcp